MNSFELSPRVLVVALSLTFSIWLIVRLWQSDDHLFFKWTLSAVALVPIVGPIVAIWIAGWPTKQHPALQDRMPRSPDVHDRWRDVFAERNPLRRLWKWRELMERERGDP